MSTVVALGVSLEVGCAYDAICSRLAAPLLEQLASGYDECSAMPLPVREWRATARKRAARAQRRGYFVAEFDRSRYTDDIHEINTSKTHRQGRPMSAGYTSRQTYGPLPHYPCARHYVRTWGVFHPEGKLVGYLVVYRCGDLALVSQILGHGEFERDEIMFLLVTVALDAEAEGVAVYNRHDSGTDGLRWFKERLGFEATAVEWLP